MEKISLNTLLDADPSKLDGTLLFKYKNALKSELNLQVASSHTATVINDKLKEYQKAIDARISVVKKTNEDAVATQGNTSGLGNITGSSPSSIVGVTTGDAYTNNGGTIGSGDISVPFGTFTTQPYFTQTNNYVYTKFLQRKKSKTNNTLKPSYSVNMKPSPRIFKYNDYIKKAMNDVVPMSESIVSDIATIIGESNIKNSADDKYSYDIMLPVGTKITDTLYTDLIKMLEKFDLKYTVDIENKLVHIE